MRILTRVLQRSTVVILISFLEINAASAAAPPILIDSFETVAGWRPVTSDGVDLNISSDAGREGNAMRLDFDFRGGAGYAIARHELTIQRNPNPTAAKGVLVNGIWATESDGTFVLLKTAPATAVFAYE